MAVLYTAAARIPVSRCVTPMVSDPGSPTVPPEAPPVGLEPRGGRHGRIQISRRIPWRVLGILPAGLVLIVGILVAVGVIETGDAKAKHEEILRRTTSALELAGVKLKPVRGEQLGTAAIQATFANEHLRGGRLEPSLLEQVKSLGPVVFSLAQTDIADEGLRIVAGQPGVLGLSLLGTGISDRGLAAVVAASDLRLLSLERTAVSDEGLRHIAGLTGLRQLYLTGTRVSGEGLAPLLKLTRLEAVKLGGTEVGDGGLAVLARLPRLKHLALDRTRITDAGVPVLAGIESLEFLDLHGTWVSVDGVQKLRDALPNCRIEH